MVGDRHGNHPILLVEFIEKPPVPYAVSPSWRFPVLQALDVGAEVRIFGKDWVNVLAELGLEALLGGGTEPLEIPQKLPRFKDLIA